MASTAQSARLRPAHTRLGGGHARPAAVPTRCTRRHVPARGAPGRFGYPHPAGQCEGFDCPQAKRWQAHRFGRYRTPQAPAMPMIPAVTPSARDQRTYYVSDERLRAFAQLSYAQRLQWVEQCSQFVRLAQQAMATDNKKYATSGKNRLMHNDSNAEFD